MKIIKWICTILRFTASLVLTYQIKPRTFKNLRFVKSTCKFMHCFHHIFSSCRLQVCLYTGNEVAHDQSTTQTGIVFSVVSPVSVQGSGHHVVRGREKAETRQLFEVEWQGRGGRRLERTREARAAFNSVKLNKPQADTILTTLNVLWILCVRPYSRGTKYLNTVGDFWQWLQG